MSESALLVIDEKMGRVLPKHNYDSLSDPVNSSINPIHIMASAQFSERSLLNIITKIKTPITIVDLRRESHGYINGFPVSWYARENRSNLNLSAEQVMKVEQRRINEIKNRSHITVHDILEKKDGEILQTKAMKIAVQQVESEKELATRLGLGYIRIPVQDHHKPLAENVKRYNTLLAQRASNQWLYLHCRGGRGRTATFVMMTDIYLNGHFLTLPEIIKRQVKRGGKNLFEIKEEGASWKMESAIERVDFIQQFYDGYAK